MKCNGGYAHLLDRRGLRILPEETVQAQSHHTEECLTEDTTRHLARTLTAIHEDNTHFLYLETNLIGCILHLNLERITLETDLVQFDCFEHLALVALESGCCVMHLETRDETNIF